MPVVFEQTSKPVAAHPAATVRATFLIRFRGKKFVALALMIPFAMIVNTELGRDSRSGRSPSKISLDRHSCLTERTQRSANAFRFGLWAGSEIVFTPPLASADRNVAQNFVSRSCSMGARVGYFFFSVSRMSVSARSCRSRLRQVAMISSNCAAGIGIPGMTPRIRRISSLKSHINSRPVACFV